MVAVEITLLVFGLIIFLGFFAAAFFERTKIPDVLLLLFLGVLLGPGLNLVAASDLIPLASTVGTLALIIVLFDSGLNLNLVKVLKEIPNATLFTVVVFLIGAVLVGGAVSVFFGWPLLHALLLGVIAGGTGSNVVLSIVQKLSVNENTKVLLGLESLINDVLVLVFAFALLQISVSSSFSLAESASDLASAFAVALVVGVLAGLFWLGVLKRFYGKPLGYMITLGFMFVLYAGIAFLGGSGAISVLVFSLVLGNSEFITKFLKWEGDFKLESSIFSTQKEVSFFVRTFYFVYLGLLFAPSFFTTPVIAVSLVALAGFTAARMVGMKVLVAADYSFKKYSLLVVGMMPRGLVSAVLAFLPAERGIIIPYFAEIVFLLLLFTNVVATVGAFAFEIQNAGSKPSPRVIAVKPKEKGKLK